MNNPVYVCEGSCKAKISEEEYKKGLMVCGNDSCERKGTPFTKMYECSDCKKLLPEPHTHSHV